ncbi:MAG: hypothetical protein ACOX0K_01105 [Oscillospiraceae bacterium]|jgi:hypothetical protein
MSECTLPLQPLSATEELAVLRQAPSLIPGLMRSGLSLEDAAALAHNATLLYYALRSQRKDITSPKGVLEQMSLRQIAEGCRRLEERKKEDEAL